MTGPSRDSLFLHPVSLFLAVLTALLWGANALAGRYALDAIPPLAVGGLRFGMAVLFMIGWCLVERSPVLLKGRDWWLAFVLGVLLYLQIGTFHLGLARSSSSHASLLVNSYIFWVAGWEHFIVLTNRLRWWQILGLMLSATGCAALLWGAHAPSPTPGRDPVTLSGNLILTLSGFILAVKVVMTKHAVHRAPVGALMLWHNVFGTLLLLATSGGFEDYSHVHWTPIAVAGLLYSGFIISGFCFGTNAWLLKRHGASQVSVFSFGSPVFGVFLGVLLRGDPLTSGLILAGVMVGLGILLVNLTTDFYREARSIDVEGIGPTT